MSSVLCALCALVTLAPAAALVTRAHTPPPTNTATMLRINTDKENLKIANKSLEFVKIIRDDLRRNNDDYVAERGAGARGSRGPAWSRGGIESRRNLNATWNETTANPNMQNVTVFRSYSHPVKHYKKVHIDKLKRLADKGKRIRLGRTPNDTLVTPESNLLAIANAAHVTTEPSVGLVTPPTSVRVMGAAVALHQHAAFGSPSPDQLDMAPARGPKIQAKRSKGRLCQRSVMNMEGPVYDAQGNTVMPAYEPVPGHGRPFSNTRAPDLVLPRCCNCCKKSVLGCQ